MATLEPPNPAELHRKNLVFAYDERSYGWQWVNCFSTLQDAKSNAQYLTDRYGVRTMVVKLDSRYSP